MSRVDESSVRIGTSSFSSKDWVGPFYPRGTKPTDFLSLYAGHFDTVEVDSTYYALPAERTVEAWAAKLPEGFLLSAKFPRSIVHGGRGKTPDGAVVLEPGAAYGDRDRFLAAMARLGHRLGPMLLQFPYFSRKAFADPDVFLVRLDRFLADLPREHRYAIEIRNRTWLNNDLVALCRSHGAALVLVDQAWMPHGDEVETILDPVSTDFVYIRLLGNRQEIEALTQTWDQVVIDREDRMVRWARLLARLSHRGVQSLVYVNNHYAGHAPATAARLRELYREEVGRSAGGGD